MGGCLTCCPPRNDQSYLSSAPSHQQHRQSSSSSKVTGPAHSYVLVPTSQPSYQAEVVRLPLQQYHTVTGTRNAGSDPVTNGKPQTNGDNSRKMFGQYPKLPPIRSKHNSSGGDSKGSSLTSSRDFSEPKINSLFDMYKDPTEDYMLADGIEKLCSDLGVRPEEFRVLVLAWKFDAETMCRFSRPEFTSGCRKLKVDSVKGIANKFTEMLLEVQNRQNFRDFYRWTYRFGLDLDIGQRTLPIDMAISLWQLVFFQNEPPILKKWLNFLEWHPSIRGIPRDTWDMFLNFTEVVKGDLSTYDDTEAWPSLFDDFVEYENDRENQNVQLDKSAKEDLE